MEATRATDSDGYVVGGGNRVRRPTLRLQPAEYETVERPRGSPREAGGYLVPATGEHVYTAPSDPVVTNPDPMLYWTATRRHWPIEFFEAPEVVS